ncbi:MAG: NfeD family protein [Candidatus Marinimicrobia bacterium]|nr:NfeD family protein [Candidatus Neomarinimicrobiota bacterium]
MNFDFLTKPEVIWFIIGLILIVLEFAIPGVIIIFFGVGAWVTALVCWIFGIGINWQLFLFLTFSLVLLFSLRKLLKRKFFGMNEFNENDPTDDFVGHNATALTNFFPNETGRVDFKGTTWEAKSDSKIKKSEQVKIIGKESIKLIVKPLNK